MPHVSKKYPLVGHGQKGGKEGGAVDRPFKNRPRGYGFIAGDDELPESETTFIAASRKEHHASICEEGGDCADRVNEE